MTTTKFVTVNVENKPGGLGKAARCLADKGVNVEAFAVDANGVARFLTNNPQTAEKCLRDNGFSPKTVEVMQVQLPNKPGSLATLGETLGREGVNIETSFGATGGGGTGTIFLRVNDVAKAEHALAKMPGGAPTPTTPGGRN